MKFNKGFGAIESKHDPRTFTYKPTKANYKGGVRYVPVDITDQDRVGICTANAFIMLINKLTGKKYSADFQYLIQKLYVDGNWDEGSSGFSAAHAGYKYGVILEKDFKKYITQKDRALSYDKYVKKLQAIPEKDIKKLLKKAIKITGYARVPVDRDLMANAIDNSKAGIIARFALGNEWWTNPIEPLRAPKKLISGHLVVISNYAGNSFRIANGWGSEWADKGTAYFLLRNYAPTEAWAIFLDELPKKNLNKKTLTRAIMGLFK